MTRALLRAILQHETGVPGGEWRLEKDSAGRPSLLGRGGTGGPFLSLSHSHGLCAMALSGGRRIGLDIEARRPRRSFGTIADWAFGPGERRAVRAEGLDAFYRIWTIREAFAKATGIPLLDLNGKDISCEAQAVADAGDGRSFWRIGHWLLDGTHDIAIALESIDKYGLDPMPSFPVDGREVLSDLLAAAQGG